MARSSSRVQWFVMLKAIAAEGESLLRMSDLLLATDKPCEEEVRNFLIAC